ncbi:MAG: hypothetical protein ABJL72_10360 [Roseobacter sp.]
MKHNDTNDLDFIDQVLAQARTERDDVPLDLIQRVTSQALALQPKPVLKQKNRWPNWADIFQRVPAMGALAAASCVGFWIGVSPPESLFDASALFVTPEEAVYNDAAEISGFGWDLQEG